MSYTMEFVFASIFMGITVGAFMGLIAVNMFAEYAHPVVKWILGIIVALAVGCAIGGMLTLESKGDDEAWNNGYCTECNEPYRFANAVHHKNSGDEYYYTCDNCGHTIVLHGLRER